MKFTNAQLYTQQTNGGNNSTFKAQTSWIVANKDALNIKHVSQLGDYVQNVDNNGNDTEWKHDSQRFYFTFETASSSLSILPFVKLFS